MSNPVTSGTDSHYTLNFILNGQIEIGGKIVLVVPSTIVLNTDAVTSIGSCTQGYTCSVATPNAQGEQTITYLTSTITPNNKVLTLTFGGCTNPRTTKTTRPFQIRTFDSKGNQIDGGYSLATSMTKLNSLTSFSVTSDSLVNGAVTDYKFSIQSVFTMKNNDKISFDFPADILAPNVTNPTCLASGGAL